jgi:hypothetical protein
MDLTVEQYTLLYDAFNASIRHAMDSGIPIGKEYYEDIDIIRDSLFKALQQARLKEYRDGLNS